MDRVLLCNQSKSPWHSFVCSVAPEDDELPLMLSYLCSIDLLMISFVSPLYTDPHEHFTSNTPGQLFYFFFDFWFNFWYPRNGNCLFFVSVFVIIITIINIIIIIIIIITIIIIELTHSKTILENTVEIEQQPAALDCNNLSQYSSRSK